MVLRLGVLHSLVSLSKAISAMLGMYWINKGNMRTKLHTFCEGHCIISGIGAYFISFDPDAVIHNCLSLGEFYFDRLLEWFMTYAALNN